MFGDVGIWGSSSWKVLSAYDPKKLIALGIPGCGGGLCSDKKLDSSWGEFRVFRGKRRLGLRVFGFEGFRGFRVSGLGFRV